MEVAVVEDAGRERGGRPEAATRSRLVGRPRDAGRVSVPLVVEAGVHVHVLVVVVHCPRVLERVLVKARLPEVGLMVSAVRVARLSTAWDDSACALL